MVSRTEHSTMLVLASVIKEWDQMIDGAPWGNILRQELSFWMIDNIKLSYFDCIGLVISTSFRQSFYNYIYLEDRTPASEVEIAKKF